MTATSANAPVAAMAAADRQLYALLFHPEVAHTDHGLDILRHFAFDVCGCTRRLDDVLVRGGGDGADPRHRSATAGSSAD